MSSAALLSNRNAKLHSLSETDVRAALRQHNPDATAANVQTMAEVIVAVSDLLAELPEAQRRKLARAKDQMREALIHVTGAPKRRTSAEALGKVERSRGTGLGARISLEEGRARLDRFATAKPLESWAGPVAGVGEIEKRLGIPRSTLSHWQQKGVAIGLLRGERKLAYPLDQFLDARPLEGLAEVLRVAPDARAAWLWLRQPHGALDGRTPLDVLRAGGTRDLVAKVAERDFA